MILENLNVKYEYKDSIMNLAVIDCFKKNVNLIETTISNDLCKFKTEQFETNEWPGKLNILKKDLENLSNLKRYIY